MREFTLTAEGHGNVSAQHASTFEFTTDDFLTPAGDCILGIEADAAASDVPRDFVDACQSEDATITARLDADGHEATITGSGHPDLTYTNDRSMVGRTSTYVDDRTILVDADTAAGDLDRDLVDALAAGATLTVTLTVE